MTNEMSNRQSAAKLDVQMKQINLDLDGFEKNYMVTEDGRVFSKYLNGFMKPFVSRGGYLRIKLNYGCKNKKVMVHRLVALTYIPNDDPDNKTLVDHINNIRTDNRVENLRWVTPSQNSVHAVESGNKDTTIYTFVNEVTGEKLVYTNRHLFFKKFKSDCIRSIRHKLNTGIPVKSGHFAGYSVWTEPIEKVQRPSLARELGKAARNGNHPSVSHNPRTWVLIWSDLIGNNELRPIVLQGAAVRVATHSEQ